MTDSIITAVFAAFATTAAIFTVIFTWMLCKEEFKHD